MSNFSAKVRALGHVAGQPIAAKTKNLSNKVNTTAQAIATNDNVEDMNEAAARLVVLAESAGVDPLDILASALVAHAEAKAKLADEAKAKADADLIEAIKNVRSTQSDLTITVGTVEQSASV